MKNILIIAVCSAALATSSVYSLQEQNDAALPTMHTEDAQKAQESIELGPVEHDLKRRSILHDTDSIALYLQKKLVASEKVLSAMQRVLNDKASEQNTDAYNVLKETIEVNQMKHARIQEDLRIQQEFNAFIREHIDIFVVVSDEVGKAMASRYE